MVGASELTLLASFQRKQRSNNVTNSAFGALTVAAAMADHNDLKSAVKIGKIFNPTWSAI